MSDLLELADQRILNRLDKSGSCWLWTGALDAAGRGRVWRRGKIKLHHRAVWEILRGSIPDGALLCHHCDNPTCANPDHLYIGTGKSNVRDMFDRNRAWQLKYPERAREAARAMGLSNDWAKGVSNPKAKLTAAEVDQIRNSSGSSYDIAPAFGVSPTTVQRIRSGKLWPARALASEEVKG